jgi:acyl carrier protein
MSETELKVKEVIKERMGLKELPEDSCKLVDDLGADSLDMVELVIGIEEAFDLNIPDNDAGELKTVKDVVNYISSKVKE